MPCCGKRKKLKKLQEDRREQLKKIAERRRLINERRKAKKRSGDV